MPNYTRPTAYPDWTDGNPSRVMAPTPSQVQSGFTAGQRPSYQLVNYQFCLIGQWLGWLDAQANAAAQGVSIEPQMRLIGGGQWSWSASSGTLSWSQPFYLQVPGLTDSQNTVAAGSVMLGAGQVGYIAANIPFTTTGSTASGSNQLTNLGYESGIAVGQQVTGAGVPTGTTVVAVNGSTVTMSQGATATATGVSFTFVGASTITASTATVSSFAPAPNTVVFARAVVPTCIVGVNAGQFVLRDNESRLLDEGGFATVVPETAGVALAARTPVYISNGDAGRTAGSIYPAEASVATGAARSTVVGLVGSATASGASAPVVTSGLFTGFTGLVPGASYFVDPANPGQLTSTRPVITGQWIAPVGTAISSTTLVVTCSAPATQVVSINPWPQYAVASQADFIAAAAACAAAGGGVIVVVSSFAMTSSITIPSGTIVQGRKGATVVTMGVNVQLNLSDQAELREVTLVAAATSSSALLTLAGSACVVRGCSFTLTPSSTAAGVAVTGNANRLYNNLFSGVTTGTATGISYASGTGNYDDGSIFLS